MDPPPDQHSQLHEDSSPDSMPSVPQEKSNEDIKTVNNIKQNEKDIRMMSPSRKSGISSTTMATVKNNAESPKEKKKKQQSLYLCTAKCRYVVVRKACRQLGFKMMEDENGDWDIHWNDTNGVTPEQLQKLQPYQRANHFPGMYQLARKNNLCRNLMRMQRVFKEDYSFFPQTWQLPTEMADFKNQFSKKKNNKTFIVKPVHLCQGKGIFLVRKFEDVELKQGDQYVAQRYLHKPYLIDGLKFDLRIYALVYGVDPLRVFVYQEGLARFATEEYVGPQNSNLDNLFMHLTNYAIQKNSDNFVFNEDQDDDSSGHKRSLTAILDHIRENEPLVNADQLWIQIQDMIAKTIITVQPTLQHAYRSSQPEDLENSMCFEVLGFDVILDHKLKPYVLEVNALASFGTDSPLDKKVKLDLMRDTFTMLNLSAKRKKQLKKDKADGFNKRVMGEKGPTKFEKEQIRKRNQAMRDEFDLNHLGNYKLVYPVLNDPEKAKKFDQFLEQSKNIWSEFTGGTKTVMSSQPPVGQQISQNPGSQLRQNQISTNRAKTDPPGQKAKALGLSSGSQLQKQQSSTSSNWTSNKQNESRIFVKRNTIYQGKNPFGDNGPIHSQQSHMMGQNRNNPNEFNQTLQTFHSHHQSNGGQPIPIVSDIVTSPTKQDTLESLTLANQLDSVQSKQQQQQNINGILALELGLSSSNNLVEAIQKRFPMVRLEHQALINYAHVQAQQIQASQQNNSNLNNLQNKKVQSLSRMSYPANNNNNNDPNINRMKPFIINAFNNSNEVGVSHNQLNNGYSTSTAVTQVSNSSSNKTAHYNSSQRGKDPRNLQTNTNHQNNYFFMQNQNTSMIQNMERYNMLKHIEAVKRTINNPQLNMMKQKISQKYQSSQQVNNEFQMSIGRPIVQNGGRHASASAHQANQPHSLAEWLQLGTLEKKQMQTFSNNPKINNNNPKLGASQSLAIHSIRKQ